MFTHPLVDTLSRIVLQNAQLIAPGVALVTPFVSHRLWDRWHDLWRARRTVLPIVDRLLDGDYDEQLDSVETHTGIDLSRLAKQLPEKTGVPL